MPLLVATFLITGVVVALAGGAIARAGDQLAIATGLGGLWIGAVVMAAATSLPELATDVAAVRIGAPELALGDVFGSGMANMLILAAVDLFAPGRPVLRRATLDHALVACLAIVLNGAAALFVVVDLGVTVLGVGLDALILVAVYLAGIRAVHLHARRPVVGPVPEPAPRGDLRRPIATLVVAAAVILVAAPIFARSAAGIADATGLGRTFVGAWLVGLSTSLPELAASVAAVRMGAVDLAVGNLFGSNAFNVAIVAPLDAAGGSGALLPSMGAPVAAAALLACLITAEGLAAVVYRGERRVAALEPDAVTILVTYVLGLWLLQAQGGGG